MLARVQPPRVRGQVGRGRGVGEQGQVPTHLGQGVVCGREGGGEGRELLNGHFLYGACMVGYICVTDYCNLISLGKECVVVMQLLEFLFCMCASVQVRECVRFAWVMSCLYRCFDCFRCWGVRVWEYINVWVCWVLFRVQVSHHSVTPNDEQLVSIKTWFGEGCTMSINKY